MKVLNLGCGTKASDLAVNIDWSIMLRLKANPYGRRVARILLTNQRWERFLSLSSNVLVYDLRKGIPFEDGEIDAVYSSHLIEHIDRHKVVGFLDEIKRVLKPGGIIRIVTPDMESLARRYLDHLDLCVDGRGNPSEHDHFIGDIIEQMVRREAAGTTRQPRLRRFLENLILGDARKRGETHQWLYDRVNIRVIFETCGFRDVHFTSYRKSGIPNWSSYGLDETNVGGEEYKPNSLYVEARKRSDGEEVANHAA